MPCPPQVVREIFYSISEPSSWVRDGAQDQQVDRFGIFSEAVAAAIFRGEEGAKPIYQENFS